MFLVVPYVKKLKYSRDSGIYKLTWSNC